MLRPRLSKNEKTVLIDLLVLMRDNDLGLTPDKLELLEQLQEKYGFYSYQYKHVSYEEVRLVLEGSNEKSVLRILSHTLLYVLENEIKDSDIKILHGYFDLLSEKSVEKMQQTIERESLEQFDVKSLMTTDIPEDEVLTESIEIMNDFTTKTEEDIDEKKLFDMNKGPVKKVWTEVLKLWEVVKDPKSDKAIKAMGIAALVYLISPIDAVPDFIPMLGLADDVGVIMYAIAQLSKLRQNNK